ncbi:MAG TPA: YncE family protein [Terriglobales bacterium]|nr:YncE family protein [Terriglobales bacterium]
MKRASPFLILFLFLAAALPAQTYKVSGTIPIPGDSGWDYLLADGDSRVLYVSHGIEVILLDLDSEKITGKIEGMKRIHGIALAHEFNRGFISDGGSDEVVVFDFKSHQVLDKVKTGMNPDGILYDPASQRVFAFNGRSSNATAIEAKSGKVAGTIPLDGKPEFPVSDGHGNVYVNIEDKSEIQRIDPKTLKVTATWSIAPCQEPSGLAIDVKSHRLFPVCDNQKMAVVDASSGKVVTTVPIGDGPDAAYFDPDKRLVFSSNGAGTLTVVKQESADKYSVVDNVKTERSARTMAMDPKTRKIYLPAASFGEAPAPTADNPHPRPKMVPGTFHLVVVSAS